MLQAVVVEEAVIDALSGRPFAVYLPVFPGLLWDAGMETEVAVVFNVDGAPVSAGGTGPCKRAGSDAATGKGAAVLVRILYGIDGIQRAIIEVKFSFAKKYYRGNTYYPFAARIGDGMKQLDKYAKHLAKGKRQVDFGYVYMFYCNDFTDMEIEEKI